MNFTGEVGSIINTDENNMPVHEELDEFEDWSKANRMKTEEHYIQPH